MLPKSIRRAWKDEECRLSLNEAHSAGFLELAEADLAGVVGGRCWIFDDVCDFLLGKRGPSGGRPVTPGTDLGTYGDDNTSPPPDPSPSPCQAAQADYNACINGAFDRGEPVEICNDKKQQSHEACRYQ